MSFSSITWFINILIVLFLSIGLIWGIRRGALKSFIRLSFLIFNCIFWVLITPDIARFILNVDLNPLLNVTIDGQTFTTIYSLANYYFTNNAIVIELVSANPILINFVEQIPAIIANFTVFILGYFLLKSLTLPIYSFVVKRVSILIAMKTDKSLNADKKKVRSKALGAVFGMLQSALTAMILFLPLSTMSVAFNGTQENSLLLSLPNLAVTETMPSTQASTEMQSEASAPTFTTTQMGEFLNLYSNTVLRNTINVMNLDGFNEYIFTKLSTVYVNNQKISLVEELKNISDTLKKTNALLQKNNITDLQNISTSKLISLVATMNYNDAEEILNTILNLKSLNVIGDDVLTYLYQSFTIGDESIEELINSLPSNISPIISSLTLSLKTGNTKLLKEDLLNLFDVVRTLKENRVFDFAKDKALLARLETALKTNNSETISQITKQILTSILETFSTYTETEIKEKLVAPIFRSSTVKRLAPSVLNLLIDTINNGLNLEIAPVERVTVSWSNEISKLSSLIYNVKEFANDTAFLLEDNVNSLNLETLDQISFSKLGAILNALQKSQLFSYLYESTLNEVFNNYLLFNSNEINEPVVFEFISPAETNWEEEFTLLDKIINSFVATSSNISLGLAELDTNLLQSLITDLFKSDLVKEIFVQSKEGIFNLILTNLQQPSSSQNIQDLLTALQIALQDMTLNELQNDFLIFNEIFGIILSNTEETLIDKITALSENQILSILQKNNNTYIGGILLPKFVNIAIAKLNATYDLSITYLENNVNLTERDLSYIASAIYNVKTVYLNYTQNEESLYSAFELETKLETVNLLKETINNISIEKLGIAIDKIKQVRPFYNTYNSILEQVVFNSEFYKNTFNLDFISYMSLTSLERSSIVWEKEFSMIKELAFMGLDTWKIEEVGYDRIAVDAFFQNYGNSKFLKLALINGVKFFFPETDMSVLLNLNLTESSVSLGGFAEAGLLFLHFREHGTITLQGIQKYRIREAIKQIENNNSLLAFIEEISQISGINYTELSTLSEILFAVFEGREFSVNALSTYLNAAPLIPWIVELIEKFGSEVKLPYYLNVYMQANLFRIKLYSIHLGKNTATNDSGETSPITTEEVVDMMKTLSKVPDFVTAQFVFDPNFIQE